MLASYKIIYNRPCHEAASKFGLSGQVFKNLIHKKYKIRRWPFRSICAKLRSVEKLKLSETLTSDGDLKHKILLEIQRIKVDIERCKRYLEAPL
jgi:hypothetical protein